MFAWGSGRVVGGGVRRSENQTKSGDAGGVEVQLLTFDFALSLTNSSALQETQQPEGAHPAQGKT